MDVFMGSIWAVAFNFAPRGCFLCQGQLLGINQYQALYSLLGTAYGGNGQTTFGLPDLRGRANIGAGQSPGGSIYAMGQKAGATGISLTNNQLPLHNHTANFVLNNAPSTPITLTVNVVNAGGNAVSPQNNFIAGGHGTPAAATFLPSGTAVPMATGSITVTGAAGITGGSVAVSPVGGAQVPLMQPYLAVNYMICISGLYPSRN